MPDEQTYNDIILQARQESLSELVRKTKAQLGREYVRSLDANLSDLPGGPDAFVSAYRAAMDRFAIDGEDRAARATRVMLQRITDAHLQAAEEVTPEQVARVRRALEDVPVKAYEQMWRRRDITPGRLKSLRKWGGSASAVRDRLLEMIQEGQSYEKAAQRIMAGLVQGDEELEDIARRFGPRGGVRRFASGDTDRTTSRIAQRIGRDARRIARTEMAQAYHEADNLSAARSRVVRGLKWTLSSNHPEYDVCDELARQDLFGLGPGVYPPGKLPSLPHPNCQCSSRFVLRDPDERGEPVDPSRRQREPEEPTEEVSEARSRRIQSTMREVVPE